MPTNRHFAVHIASSHTQQQLSEYRLVTGESQNSLETSCVELADGVNELSVRLSNVGYYCPTSFIGSKITAHLFINDLHTRSTTLTRVGDTQTILLSKKELVAAVEPKMGQALKVESFNTCLPSPPYISRVDGELRVDGVASSPRQRETARTPSIRVEFWNTIEVKVPEGLHLAGPVNETDCENVKDRERSRSKEPEWTKSRLITKNIGKHPLATISVQFLESNKFYNMITIGALVLSERSQYTRPPTNRRESFNHVAKVNQDDERRCSPKNVAPLRKPQKVPGRMSETEELVSHLLMMEKDSPEKSPLIRCCIHHMISQQRKNEYLQSKLSAFSNKVSMHKVSLPPITHLMQRPADIKQQDREFSNEAIVTPPLTAFNTLKRQINDGDSDIFSLYSNCKKPKIHRELLLP